MSKPHKHATLIKKWADGAEIECRYNGGETWHPLFTTPTWNEDTEYRVASDHPPKELWVNAYPKSCVGWTYPSLEEAEEEKGSACIGTYRYVLAEDQE